MTPDVLDSILMKLTAHEEQYKSGSSFYYFEDLPMVERNGQKMYFMKFSDLPDSATAVTSNLLYLKKQSRYQVCPTHVHEWLEMNYMYSGSCPQMINHTDYQLQKGQVLLIDTDTPHSTDALGDRDIMISLMVNKEYLNSSFFNRFSEDSILSAFFINSINENTNHDNYILFHSEQSRKLPLFFNELLCEIYDPSINHSDIINSLFTLILCELINVYEKDINQQNLDLKRNSISPILRFIEGNFKTCTLENTANFFNMNPNYLTTLLKQQTGYSYKELVQRQRLAKSSLLLRNTSTSITEIANAVGYENISFYYRKFKEQFHCSPKEYRMKYSL